MLLIMCYIVAIETFRMNIFENLENLLLSRLM